MDFFSLILWISLASSSTSRLDRSRVTENYAARPKVAVVMDAIRVQLRLLRRLQWDSSGVELIDALTQFILLERNSKQMGFYNNGQLHSVVGVTSNIIAESACDYLQDLVSSSHAHFNCSTRELQDISEQVKLYKAVDNINSLVWDILERRKYPITAHFECTFWNTRQASNCSGLASIEMELVEVQEAMRREYYGDCQGVFAIC